MSSEITRASDADRERFVQHLSSLYARGYISEAEAEGLRQRILNARSLAVLESELSGFPKPEKTPPPGRDWGMPENFVPPCIATAFTGLLVAVIPATALAHRSDALSDVLTALAAVTGITIVICAVITAICAGFRWSDIDYSERERRRAEQKRR